MSKRDHYQNWCSNLTTHVLNHGSSSEKELATLLTILDENTKGVGDIKVYPGMIEVDCLTRGDSRRGTITIEEDKGYYFHGNMSYRGSMPSHDYTLDVYIPQVDPITQKVNKGYYIWDSFLKSLYDLLNKET